MEFQNLTNQKWKKPISFALYDPCGVFVVVVWYKMIHIGMLPTVFHRPCVCVCVKVMFMVFFSIVNQFHCNGAKKEIIFKLKVKIFSLLSFLNSFLPDLMMMIWSKKRMAVNKFFCCCSVDLLSFYMTIIIIINRSISIDWLIIIIVTCEVFYFFGWKSI